MEAYREIALSRGMVALVDDADYSWLSEHRWFAFTGHAGKYYAIRNDRSNGPNNAKRMHREIVGAGVGEIVDHINGDGLDNRRANLRLCTNSQNTANGRKRSKTKRFKGVHRLNRGPSWHACIGADGRQHYLGAFATEEEAARAYDVAAISLFGEFARTNAAMGLFNTQEVNV